MIFLAISCGSCRGDALFVKLGNQGVAFNQAVGNEDFNHGVHALFIQASLGTQHQSFSQGRRFADEELVRRQM